MIKKYKYKNVKKYTEWAGNLVLIVGVVLILSGLDFFRNSERLRPSAPTPSRGSISVSLTQAGGCYAIRNGWTGKEVLKTCGPREISLPAGVYRIEYKDLCNAQKPFARTVSVSAGSREKVMGVYSPGCMSHNFRIEVRPCNAHYRLISIRNNQVTEQRGPKSAWLEAGDYRIEFLHLPGHRTPDPVRFRIGEGKSASVKVQYEKSAPVRSDGR